MDCSGIVSSGLVETTDISCGSIYADGVPGTLGQVLSSNGTGIEWVDGTTVGSQWSVDSSGINYTSGNVGIGKDSSNNVALDVSGNMAINGTINTLTVGFGSGDISNNTVVGYQALQSNTTGSNNTATGYQALQDNTGNNNVGVGFRALYKNTTGHGNTAVGESTIGGPLGGVDMTGSYNVAMGEAALYQITDGSYNVATGSLAMYSNQGSANVAVGYRALNQNFDGSKNTALGHEAGLGQSISGHLQISNTINIGYDTSCNASNTACIGNVDISCVYLGSTSGLAKLDCSGIVSSGDAIINTLTVGLGGGNNATNTAIGDSALGKSSVLSNPYNTAIGYHALFNNTIGSNNVAIGSDALGDNIDGGYNVAIGSNALQANIDGQYNVATGYQALSTNDASFNTAVGYQALTSNTNGGYNVAMGSYALKLND